MAAASSKIESRQPTPLREPEAGSLYGTALGRAASQLDPAVRALHCSSATAAATGSFTVTHRQGAFARLLIEALGFPAAGGDVPVQLCIERTARGEVWRRHFGQQRLCTRQRILSDGRLEEQVGGVRLLLAVTADGDALVIRQVGAALHVGRWRLPLPMLLCPRTTARAAPAPAGGVAVAVEITCPGGSFLAGYSGVIQEVRQR